MTIPSTVVKEIQNLRAKADDLQELRLFEEAQKLLDIANRFEVAWKLEDDEFLTMDEAVVYSRGYSAAYLRRTLFNYGSKRNPRFRKGDVPRHPVQRNAA